MLTIIPTEHAPHTAALAAAVPTDRPAMFHRWISDGLDPLDLPPPSTWPEFDAKWTDTDRTRDAVLTSREHWDRYHSDLLHVNLIGRPT